jgi:hypothetical protein
LLFVGFAVLSPAADASGHGHGWLKNHAPATTTTAVATDDGNGANVGGAYDPWDVGNPSENGNGGGNANGKPCDGCMGNADDKNPPGQAVDGSDHNHGYECDVNHGIAKTNPAHSSCDPGQPTTTTSAPTTTTTEATTTTTEATTTTTAPATTTTSSAETTTTAGVSVLGEEIVRGEGFARTGAFVVSWGFALGLLLIVAGATLLVGDQRRRSIAS